MSVSGVSHSFGDKKVLDNISLAVPRGAFTVLLGLNGAGKSTLFALVTRLYDNVSGEIRILGNDVRRRPTAALQRLGVVFQSRTLDSDLSLQQNLLYHAALHGIGPRESRARAAEALETVGLADRANETVRSLSGGQARRVEIARSLLHRPGLLLLDEATVGLDIGSRESVLGIVRGLVQKSGLGVLWATHLIDEIAPNDRVIVLHKGRVLHEGSVPSLLQATGSANVRDAFRKMTGSTGDMEAAR
ncbi:MAG: ATP-binding cassette domain-containing protein [Hyphomicrobium sp.]|nr:ATP-binding cassette domain-containing protein [Hyphomicrobium sp.]